MNKKPEALRDLPKAIIKDAPRFSIIWIVPVVAAVAAGIWLYMAIAQSGPLITIRFKDGTGVRQGQSVIRYRGVDIGEVRAVSVNKDFKQVMVTVRLQKAAAGVAREQSRFWIVRPEISAGSVRGLGTIVSGPYIQVEPGGGPPRKEFTGDNEPSAPMEEGGLEVVLVAPRASSIRPGSPVTFRGVEVGLVENFKLSSEARVVEIHARIARPYVALVRTNSVFWNAGGLSIDVGLFRGAEISAQSFKALVGGAVAFASPETLGSPAPPGSYFQLHDKPDDKWLEWSPAIELDQKK